MRAGFTTCSNVGFNFEFLTLISLTYCILLLYSFPLGKALIFSLFRILWIKVEFYILMGKAAQFFFRNVSLFRLERRVDLFTVFFVMTFLLYGKLFSWIFFSLKDVPKCLWMWSSQEDRQLLRNGNLSTWKAIYTSRNKSHPLHWIHTCPIHRTCAKNSFPGEVYIL